MTNGMPNPSVVSEDFWASIRKRQRKDGSSAHTVLCHLGGRQFPVTFDDGAAAEAFRATVKAHGIHRAMSMHNLEAPNRYGPSAMTVGKWIGQHLDALSGVERKTLVEYRRYLTRDIEPTLGNVPLAALSRPDIGRWVNKLHTDGASGKTISNKLGFLSGCLNAAVRDGHIPANPAAGIRLPRTVRREMCFLTPTEFELLKTGFTERWHPLLDLLVTSGCRFSEATALTPADIDRANNTIRIHKAWKRVPDGDGDCYELGQPKTRRSVRSVSLPASVIDNLDLDHEWVFTNSQGGPVRLYSWRSNVWMPSLAKVRAEDPDDPGKVILAKRPRIHDLRHTAASWLLGAGVPLIVVSGHLGHEDTAVTARVYGHLDRTAGNAAADAMTKLITAGVDS
jgi:integrase